ncbi:MAG: hypothetical protein ACTIJ9_07130 [Aequorivita sp.]
MKNKILILIIVLISFLTSGYAQDEGIPIADSYKIVGEWLLDSNENDVNLYFIRKPTTINTGLVETIQFFENGNLNYRRFLTPMYCGNDLSRIPKKGKWALDYHNSILKTSIPIGDYGTEFKILKLKNNDLVLSKLYTEESLLPPN